MSNIQTSLILLITALCSGLAVLAVNISAKTLKLLLAFSGAFLLSLSALRLIPEIFSEAPAYAGLFLLAGFFLQVLLEYLTEGIEHGHIHRHEHEHGHFPSAMLAGLCIHSFLEGMPLAGRFSTAALFPRDYSLVWGIVLHNVPISIALVSMLLGCGLKKNTAIAWLVVFALMSPAGIFASQALSGHLTAEVSSYSKYILAVVVGIFLHVSTTIIFETSEHHRFNALKLLTILAGAALAFSAV